MEQDGEKHTVQKLAQEELNAHEAREINASGEKSSAVPFEEWNAAANVSAQRYPSAPGNVASGVAGSREPIEPISLPSNNAPIDLLSSPVVNERSATVANLPVTEATDLREGPGVKHVDPEQEIPCPAPLSSHPPIGNLSQRPAESEEHYCNGPLSTNTNGGPLPSLVARSGLGEDTTTSIEEPDMVSCRSLMKDDPVNDFDRIVTVNPSPPVAASESYQNGVSVAQVATIQSSDAVHVATTAVTQEEPEHDDRAAVKDATSASAAASEPSSSLSTTAMLAVNESSEKSNSLAAQVTNGELPVLPPTEESLTRPNEKLEDSDEDDDICIILDSRPGAASAPSPELSTATTMAVAASFPSTGGSSSAMVAAAPVAPTGTETEPVVADEYAAPEEVLTFVGSCLFSVIDIQNYEGTAHPGEYVNLIREPSRETDICAVRVDNLRNEQVGHIMAAQAAPLAVVMDKGSKGIKVDGTIVESGMEAQVANDRLTILIALYARDVPSHNALVRIAAILDNFLGPVGFVRHPSAFPALAQPTQRFAEVIDLTAPATETEAAAEWQTHQQQLDDMFEKQTRDQLANLPDIGMPTQLYEVKLFDHQVAGIKWMVHRETGTIAPPFYQKVQEHGREVWLSEITHCSQFHEPRQVKGGILADDMGLGKTIQAISLILSNPPGGHTYSLGSSGRELRDSKPAAVDSRHLSQVDPQFTLNGMGMAFHPPGMDSGWHHPQYEVQSNHKIPAPVCTLIVSPVSVMSNWVHQIDAHVKDNVLRYAIYHGTDRDAVRAQVQSNEIDVLVVSYNTLAADFTKVFPDEKKNRRNKATAKRKYDSLQVEHSLFGCFFHRVILDEAHLIRNMSTRMFKACQALQAEHRWCLTGTPLQNKPDDINSLFAFLGVEPLGDRDVFRRAISQPIELGDDTGFARLRAMMAHIALRRNKSAIEELKLPPKEIQICKVSFPPDGFHKKVHDALFATSRAVFQATIREGGDAALLKNYISVLETLLRIRQACCSGTLVPEERRQRADAVLREIENRGDILSEGEGKELLEKLKGSYQSREQSEEEEVPECAVCLCEMEESEAVILRTCSHVFCAPCLARLKMLGSNLSCPLCRTDFVESDMMKKNELLRSLAVAPQPQAVRPATISSEAEQVEASPKIRALLEAIKGMEGDEKGVIFSQFTKFLDIIEPWLRANGHSFTRIDGSKNATDRIESMKAFSSEEGGPRFILCSLHAAGTGINLTRGSHIFLMDTWWNMAVEHQAFDRCHRIGQRRKVRVLRFIMSGTIEEKMVRIQEAKATMGKGAMEKLDPAEVRQARIGDLKSLFDIGSTADDPIVID